MWLLGIIFAVIPVLGILSGLLVVFLDPASQIDRAEKAILQAEQAQQRTLDQLELMEMQDLKMFEEMNVDVEEVIEAESEEIFEG